MIAVPVEWLETDGLGGYASSTANGLAQRRYHGLLVSSRRPPLERLMVVNGIDAFVACEQGKFALSSHKYAPGITHPDGMWRIESFEFEPWPSWTYRVSDQLRVRYEVFMRKGFRAVYLSWHLEGASKIPVQLTVRPFLSCRNIHSLKRHDAAFCEESKFDGSLVYWKPRKELPLIAALSNGQFVSAPQWYYGFCYDEERRRGYDFMEDLNSPGEFSWNLSLEDAVLVFASYKQKPRDMTRGKTAKEFFIDARKKEQERREAFSSCLELSADSYIVKGTKRKTIIAGYPWFTDWGRDTFIAIRGLCIASGRLKDAAEILISWSEVLSEGMMPNSFPERGEAPQYNSVDASLWFVICAHELLETVGEDSKVISSDNKKRLLDAIASILKYYACGTRCGIRCDDDGLLACGEPGSQLTWMDARFDEYSVTPRVGKPVEIQALWLNCLAVAKERFREFGDIYQRALKFFEERFWCAEKGYLYDVVDVEHRAGVVDKTFRPNQILSVGGLPEQVLSGDKAKSVVRAVQMQLLTPFGLRTLSQDSPCYVPRYQGGLSERDCAYHQGTVWPWLLGPFVEAWVRVLGGSPEVKQEARQRFLGPLMEHIEQSGIGHVSEVFDAEPPHRAGGCPFQAWSIGELLRLERRVLK